ncbi:MAG: CBM20 domain-containing protein [Clostridia bacterium]|nr:CBM20 domain-containing protein [Clostridia bacterium]
MTFTVNNATTYMGQNVYIAGNCAELGNWLPASAVGPGSCPNYPTWTVKVSLPAGQSIQFKAIKKDGNGNVVWEGGSNRTYTVPASGTGSVTWTWVN